MLIVPLSLLVKMMSDFFAHLLTVHHAMQVQCDAVVDEQLMELYSRIAQQIMQIRQIEAPYLEQRSQLLEQIRPYLEDDARSVLPLPEFQLFVEQFLATCNSSLKVADHPPIISVNPSTWLLNHIPFPLQLSHYRSIQQPRFYAFQLTARLETWQQTFAVTIARPTADGSELDFFGVDRQWAEILAQIRLDTASLHVFEQEARLVQEVGCLICFVGSIFELISPTVWFTFP